MQKNTARPTIDNVYLRREIPLNMKILLCAIRSSCTNKLILATAGSDTMMSCIEPHLVELISTMCQICCSLAASESLSLANNLIIVTQLENTPYNGRKKEMSATLNHLCWEERTRIFKNGLINYFLVRTLHSG